MLLDLLFHHHDDDPITQHLAAHSNQGDVDSRGDAAALLREIASHREPDPFNEQADRPLPAVASGGLAETVDLLGEQGAFVPVALIFTPPHGELDAGFAAINISGRSAQRNADALALILGITETLQ